MSTLKQLVIDEATKLRLHATEAERDRLNFENLNPDRATLCIYGQMTGTCWSERAAKLLSLCAKPYSSKSAAFSEPLRSEFSEGLGRPFSPIECFIYQACPTTNHLLISFIKGQKETLTIDEI